jgi:hypothetical protein
VIFLSAGNPMRVVLMTVLIFQMVVFGLAIPVMIFVSNVPAEAAAGFAGGAAVLALAAAALLRSSVGYMLGWLTQLVGLALGLLTASMFLVGALLAAVWILAFVLGKRLDSQMETSPGSGDIP